MRVAIVGGGITGLATAYRLTKAGLEVQLLESSSRLGGVIQTKRRQDYLMEAGPESFLDKGVALALCADLGLSSELIQVRPEHRHSFIARGRRLLSIPEGLYMMAPGAIMPFLRSSVVSPLGKARMLLDLVEPSRASSDESVGSFVRRRLGQEALDRLAQPLLGGIYGADPEHLSLAATMPQFLEMERKHGSVIRALLARKSSGVSGARYGLFHTFRNGMQTLVDALARVTPAPTLDTPVASLDQVDADAVVLCVPLPEIARLAPDLPLPKVAYSSVVTINLGFPRSSIRHPLNGAGFVVPRVEGRSIVACTFASQKFEGRAAEDRVLLRVFAGGMLNPATSSMADGALVASALRDVDELLGINGEPEQVWLTRVPNSMPQYEVGHLEAVAHLESALAAKPRLALAGNSYHGVGMPDCVASGFAAADRLLKQLR